MKIKMLFSLIGFCLVFTLAFGNPQIAPYTDPTKPIIINKDAGQFDIRLPSTPGTGYSWRLKNYDANLIKPITQTFVHPKNSLLGGEGIETFSFKVTKDAYKVKRITAITFVYVRPWNLEIGKTITFNILSQ